MCLSITKPDGLLFSLYGPVEGSRHEFILLRQSEWEGVLERALIINGEKFNLFADSAFMLRFYLICAL